ncbi:MAG TPA: methyltransferase [Bacilli bacterium]|nr:methyltransferase [Bacilli bacterium]
MKKIFNRLLNKPNWHNLRNLKPVSSVFGLDRGTPIDRIYIEDFLNKNKICIQGVVCEIGEDIYSKKFGSNIKKVEILHYTNDNPKATIIGDLVNVSTLPKNKIDCFILTQTLNFIYDFKSAIKGIYYMLKSEGVALVTVAGISQISRYDMDRWGDYWRFTDLSMKKSFEEVFGIGNVEIETYGNVLAATAFLQGICAEELTKKELFYQDKDYQVTIAIKAKK